MRDFIYKRSDILVAAAIILIASLVIYSRVDIIMGGAASGELSNNPGQYVYEQIPTETPDEAVTPGNTNEPTSVTPEPEGTNDGSLENTAPEDPNADANATQESAEPVIFTVEIGTSSEAIARNLVAAGLIESSSAFLKEVRKQKAEKKLKAGTFKITPGTSLSKIVKILSN